MYYRLSDAEGHVVQHAVMLCSELDNVRLTSIYYVPVTGNQELLAAPSEDF